MRINTTRFKDDHKNDKFRCGMYTSPYAQVDQCQTLATRIVTDESYLAYRRYWARWNKFHPQDNLPMMHVKIICDEHLKKLRSLPDDPTERKK